MSTINGKVCVVDGVAIDKVFSNGNQVYGRNLVTGTSNELKTVTGSGWGSSPASPASGIYGAGKYYASAYIENTTPVVLNIYVKVEGHTGNFNGNYIQPGKSGTVNCTVDILEGQSLVSTWLGFRDSQTASYTYKYKEMMIKRAPSTWTPAPEDVLKGDITAPNNLVESQSYLK